MSNRHENLQYRGKKDGKKKRKAMPFEKRAMKNEKKKWKWYSFATEEGKGDGAKQGQTHSKSLCVQLGQRKKTM